MEKYHFLTIIFLVHCLMVSSVSATITNITTEQHALHSLKARITHDPTNLLSKNWSMDTSVCSWIGVTCGIRHHRVKALNISYLNLTGTIPPQLGNLSFLTMLAIRNNSFYGPLPNELSHLRRLKYLLLEGNNFVGSIPLSLGNISSLQVLNLGDNQLVGNIPSSVFQISSLEILDLHYNQLSGTIPRAVGNSTKLKKMFLLDNELQGQIPQELGNLEKLEALVLGQNALTGPIPSLIFNISSLTLLHFRKNNLMGSLPDKIYQHLPVLKGLYLSYNQLKGRIPRDLGNLTSLTKIKLGSNYFTGEIPYELGNLPNLEGLGLHSNNLTGFVPATIFNISTLETLTLNENKLSGNLPSSVDLRLPNVVEILVWGNNFSGPIPSFITNASSLSILEMNLNSFSGFIPNTIGNSLTSLEDLNLSDNHLTSSTPDLSFLSSLSYCKNLRTLDLSGNPLSGILRNSISNLSVSLEYLVMQNSNISGTIDKQFGNLSSLMTLDLRGNRFVGSVPSTFSQLKNLQGLYLQSNKLEGPIPDDLCHFNKIVDLHLEGNKLSGPIPACLSCLTSLRTLSLGSNRLTSIIPPSLSMLKDILYVNLSSNSLTGPLPLDIGNLKVVISVDISGNHLSGDIPTTIGELKCLQLLNLRHNNLQGPIPRSVGELISLEFLDLSQNNLSREIPKSLEALSYLKYLNLSSNRLERNIPRGGALANFSIESFTGNFALCGSLLLHVPACKSSNHHKSRITVLLIAFPLGTAILLFVLIFILFLTKCRKRSTKLPSDVEISPQPMWRKITYQELMQATGGFTEGNLLGQGSLGSVYRGIFLDGIEVAVKVFHLQYEGALKSFDTECAVMSRIRHRNLIKIINCYSNDDFKALVLDYMPNGSLHKCLYSNNCFLDLLQRLNIMIDVASALEYLHFGYSIPIIHCDLKPSNVLLDEKMVAHLSDFGLAKLLGEEECPLQTQTLATVGYMAPEYGREGKVSRECDVYSYGIMLMETFTRKNPTNEIFVGEMSLKNWVNDSLHNTILDVVDIDLLRNEHQYCVSDSSHGTIMEVVDIDLLSKEDQHFATKELCVSSILSIAIECTTESPEMRISIKEVVQRLLKIRVKLLANIDSKGRMSKG